MNEAALAHDNRDLYGASYYSRREHVGTADHGRTFKRTHGDGNSARKEPQTTQDGLHGIMSHGGMGSGEGVYGYGREYHAFNPYSPIAYRPYEGWSGGGRTTAYGARFVRTAE